MENKIKVTVEYEKPTMSKIDALLKEYEAAANVASETKRELTPVIKEVGLAKHAAIMKQLEPIMDGMKKLSHLNDILNGRDSGVRLVVYYEHPGVGARKFIIDYGRGNNCEKFDIKYCVSLESYSDKGENFKDTSSDEYNLMFGGDRGIVTHWNKLGIIDKLNKELEKRIKDNIDSAFRIKKATENKLNNLIND